MKEIKWSYSFDEKDVNEVEGNDKDDDNNKDNNNDKGISALGLDRDMGFSGGHQGHQGHKPHDDDEEEKEEDDKVDNNNKDVNKDDTNYKGISALGLDRDLGFSRGHQGHQGHQPHRPHDDDDDEEDDDEVEDNN